MATQSTPPATQNPQNPGSEGDKKDVLDEIANGSPEKPVFASPDPIREDQVQNAVKFLSHPKVRGSPVIYRRSFLEKKGLTKEEIDEAFRRIPDQSPSNATNAEAAVTNQGVQTKPSSMIQQPNSLQSVQPAISPAVIVKQRFSWYHLILATGILSATGAGTAIFFRRVIVPRVKSWILKVVSSKEEETEGVSAKSNSKLAEEAAEAAKSAASAAAIVAKASQDLLSSKIEERGYFEAFMQALDMQVKEMKSMGEVIRKLESKREKENGFSKEKQMEEYTYSTTRNGPSVSPWRTQQNTNGLSSADYSPVRPSSATVSAEPINQRSDVEIMSMGQQRVEKIPSIKPWELAPTPASRPSNSYAQSQSSDDGSNPEMNENYNYAPPSYPTLNGKSPVTTTTDSSDSWWRKKSVKITEMEPEAAAGSDAGSSQSTPAPRRWVPPQPPAVMMPEAVAAIRHPKPKQQKSSLLEDGEGLGEETTTGKGLMEESGSVNNNNNNNNNNDNGNEIEEEGERVEAVEVN